MVVSKYEVGSGTCVLPSREDALRLETFQLVCRPFRNIAIHLPRLWAYVHDWMSIDRMRLHLLRSGSVGMELHLEYGRVDDLLLSDRRHAQWSFIKTHRLRWTSADVLCGELDSRVLNEYTDTMTLLLNLDLPSLETLSIRQYSVDSDVLQRFNWLMPKLRVFKCRTEEDLMLPLRLANPLECFVFGEELEHKRVEVVKIMAFLALPLNSHLRSITIFLDDFCYDEGPLPQIGHIYLGQVEILNLLGDDVFAIMALLDLPKLKTLRIRISESKAGNDDFATWLGRWATPALVDFEVTFIEVLPLEERIALFSRVMSCFALPPMAVAAYVEYTSQNYDPYSDNTITQQINSTNIVINFKAVWADVGL